MRISMDRTRAALAGTSVVMVGAIAGVVSEQVPFGYAVLALALSVVGLLALTKWRKVSDELAELRSGSTSGIVKVYDSPADARADLCQQIADAKTIVRLVGISHRSLLSDTKLFDALSRFLREPNAKLDVFLLASDAPALSQRALDEDEDQEAFAADVAATSKRFVRWAQNNGRDRVAFFLYRQYPSWRIEQVDETLFVSSYPLGATGQSSQVWAIRPTARAGSLHDAFSTILTRRARDADVLAGDGLRGEESA